MAEDIVKVTELPKAEALTDDDTLLLIRQKEDNTQECYQINGKQFNGKSAYEVAVEQGFTGTYEQWQAELEKTTEIANAVDNATTAATKVEDLIKNFPLTSSAAYGIEFDVTISSTTCTRIGSTDLHKSLPVQNRMKGCLLNDNGDVVEYLDPLDWTSGTRDGSRGQVMVELPEYYEKFETDGNKRRVWLSEYPLPGFRQVPKRYVSAYQAVVSSGKLCSVAGGLASSNVSLTGFRNYARARKSGSTEWNCMMYDIQRELYWLFAVEYAQLSCQTAYNAQLTSEGYHQGGLGAGVSTVGRDTWGTYNGYKAFVTNGVTDSLGNRSGVVSFNTGTQNKVTLGTVSVPRYRGVENPFAHLWQWTDGINIMIYPSSGVSEVWICRDPAGFNDNSKTADNSGSYSLVGNESRSEGYVKEITFGEYGDITAKAVGGSNASYFGDYHNTNIPTSVTLRGVSFGGNARRGSTCGFVYSYSVDAPSLANATVGSRLYFYVYQTLKRELQPHLLVKNIGTRKTCL